jgi:di/tricarboxylate transporter
MSATFGMTNILLLIITIGALVLFVTEKLRADLVALCVLVCLVLAGLISPQQVLDGFASPATATVAAMFVLSAGLARTGVIDVLGRRISRIAGKSPRGLILILCVVIAALSAFVVNTATVAVFIPVAIALAKERRVSPSGVLIPLSYASQFGGVCTVIGTSTNILVNSIARANGLDGFGLFEFAPLGLVMSALGIIYLVLFSKWLLPKRKGEAQQIDKYRLVDYISEVRIGDKSPLIGKTWKSLPHEELHELDLIQLIRGKKATWRPTATILKQNDILLLHGRVDDLLKIRESYGLEPTKTPPSDQRVILDNAQLIEVLIPPTSFLVGRTLTSSRFSRRFGGIVLAVQRRGRNIRDRISEIRFQSGDTLLLQCEKTVYPKFDSRAVTPCCCSAKRRMSRKSSAPMS